MKLPPKTAAGRDAAKALGLPFIGELPRDRATLLLVRALTLLNEKPRFGPRDRRAAFDSYSLASDITALLEAQGVDWHTYDTERN